jgi:hypothetical protein
MLGAITMSFAGLSCGRLCRESSVYDCVCGRAVISVSRGVHARAAHP